jgi:hypothetical protein
MARGNHGGSRGRDVLGQLGDRAERLIDLTREVRRHATAVAGFSEIAAQADAAVAAQADDNIVERYFPPA